MLKGKDLAELARAVQDAASRKVDIVADTRDMHFRVDPATKRPRLQINPQNDARGVTLTEHAFSQITEHEGIPARYVERMLTEAPDLLENNVNHWLQRKPAVRLVRGMSGMNDDSVIRAFLSNRYRRMDHEDQLATILPELQELATTTGIQVMSTELTDLRMYLKVVFPRFEGEVKVGDIVRFGFTIQNSEIGAGTLCALPWCDRLRCTNGMVLPITVADARLRKTHLGRTLEEGADFYSDETVQADDKALALKLRDTIRAFADRSRWDAVLEKMRAAANSTEVRDPVATIERVAPMIQLPKAEANLALANFLRDNDLTKWGLANAVTAVANTSESYDRACELEQIGGRIMTMPDAEWRELAKAA